jgi:TolA-binding protein
MKKSMMWLFAALLLPAVLTACGLLVAGGAGAGAAYVYERGWLERQYEVPLEQANQTVEQIAQNLEMNIEDRNDKVAGSEFKTVKGDQTTWIRTESKGANMTVISVRTGYVGDQEASRAIHREIESAMG